MCSLCRLPVAKNHNFGQILNFGGLLYRLPFTDKGQIWYPEADRTSTLTCQISSKSVNCVGFQWQKKQWQMLTFGGLLYRPPITDEGQIWSAKADRSSTLTGRISSECVHFVAFRWPKPQCWANFEFWGLLYRLPFTDKGQTWCPEADRTSTLTCQISSKSVHCVGFQWPKTTIWGKF